MTVDCRMCYFLLFVNWLLAVAGAAPVIVVSFVCVVGLLQYLFVCCLSLKPLLLLVLLLVRLLLYVGAAVAVAAVVGPCC